MDVSQTIKGTLREPAGSEESSGNPRLPDDVSDGRVRTREVSMDVRVGVGNPVRTAVRPMRKAAENLATIDNVAADEMREDGEETMADEVDEEQGDEEEEGQQQAEEDSTHVQLQGQKNGRVRLEREENTRNMNQRSHRECQLDQ